MTTSLAALTPPLTELAEAYGVATDFWDWQGNHVNVGLDTVAHEPA